jgi:hypothetical protein
MGISAGREIKVGRKEKTEKLGKCKKIAATGRNKAQKE